MRTLPERRRCHRCQRIARSHEFAQVGFHPDRGYTLWPSAALEQDQQIGTPYVAVPVCQECYATLADGAAVPGSDGASIIDGDVVDVTSPD